MQPLGLLLLFFLIVSGCTSYPGKKLPVRTYADLVQGSDKRTCVEMFGNAKAWHPVIMGSSIYLLEKSGYFLKAPEHCTPKGEEQNSITLNLYEDPQAGDILVSMVGGFIGIASLTVLPGYSREGFMLNVKLKKKGQVVKEYTYREDMITWVHFSLIFKTHDHQRFPAIGEVYERMLMNFLYDYSHDVQQHDVFAVGQEQSVL
jgi:hypothetical protein